MTAAPRPVESARWLLRCPVDDAWIAPGVDDCPDCGLSTGPLRALASVAAANLELAAAVSPDLAATQVEAASGLVPESENFLLDVGRALAVAGAYDDARRALERASKIAPGRKDIKAELADVSQRIDPTAWLTTEAPRASKAIASAKEVSTPARAAPLLTPRAALMADHAVARSQRDGAVAGSTEYKMACFELARIEIAVASLSQGQAAVA